MSKFKWWTANDEAVYRFNRICHEYHVLEGKVTSLKGETDPIVLPNVLPASKVEPEKKPQIMMDEESNQLRTRK